MEEAGDSDSNGEQLQQLSDTLNRVIILGISENVLFYIARRNNRGLIKVFYDAYRTIKYAEQAFRHTVKGNGEMKINMENNLIKKMTNHVIVTNGPRIE